MDPTLALSMAWNETRRQSKNIDNFVKVFEKRTELTAPAWWAEKLKHVNYDKENESYLSIDQNALPMDSAVTKVIQHNLTNVKFSATNYEVEGLNIVTPGHPFRVSVTTIADRHRWQAQVWALGTDLVPRTGRRRIDVLGVTFSDTRIGIFGICARGVFAEVFELSSGRPVCRFASRPWEGCSEVGSK
jgi:hypothetical protein